MQKFKLLLPFFLFPLLLFGQQKYTISGYVEDATSGEKLLSAAVVETEKRLGITTNTYGFFSLTLPAGQVSVQTSFVGYDNQIQSFLLRGDTLLTIRLSPIASLQTVEVSATRNNRVENQVQMSQISLPIAQIKKLPSLLGETDILKVLQLLPGIKFGTEGSSGLYVRGGSNDQNLILLDGVPVYNAAHFGGIFSVFNADAIKNVQITTGGFPARYGGRLSSVVEIDMKEGNMKQFHTEASVGVVSSKIFFEGPIIKDKMSFMVSARRTYADLLIRPSRSREVREAESSSNAKLEEFALYFYDLNAKLNYKINDKHRLFFSVYNGLDKNGETISRQSSTSPTLKNTSGDFYQWGNLTAAFRWNWLANSKLFVNTAITRSTYDFGIRGVYEGQTTLAPSFKTISPNLSISNFKYNSDVRDWAIKFDASYVLNPTHQFRFGASATYHNFSPGLFRSITSTPKTQGSALMDNKDTTFGNKTIRSVEPSAYVEDEIRLGRLTANVGVHAGFFFVDNITYPSVQPRVSLLYKVSNGSALKASFVTMRQFVNLLTNDGLGFPTDLWVSSTRRLKPQEAWQAALGYAVSIGEKYDITVETYYKDMKNVLSYKEGASYLDQVDLEPWEEKVTQGLGKAYGLEVFFRKKTGKTTGWISYTWSKNDRQFDDVNGGKWFPFRYDRRHELSLVAVHELTKRLSFSWNWNFATSNPISIPIGLFQFPLIDISQNQIKDIGRVIIYGERNSFRPSLYHRLDFNFDYVIKRKMGEHKISVGAFNAYNRENPFYYDLKTDERGVASGFLDRFGKPVLRSEPRLGLQQVSLIPILPYVSYGIKF